MRDRCYDVKELTEEDKQQMYENDVWKLVDKVYELTKEKKLIDKLIKKGFHIYNKRIEQIDQELFDIIDKGVNEY